VNDQSELGGGVVGETGSRGSSEARDLVRLSIRAAALLTDNFEASVGSSFVAGSAGRLTIQPSSRPRAQGNTIRSGTSCSSPVSKGRSRDHVRARSPVGRHGARPTLATPVLGKPAERSVKRSVKRSRERSPERSSSLSPGSHESPGGRARRVERLLVRLHTRDACIAGVPSMQRRTVLLTHVISARMKLSPCSLAYVHRVRTVHGTTHTPTTDLGYLLRKNPARCALWTSGSGRRTSSTPWRPDERCTAALLIDVDDPSRPDAFERALFGVARPGVVVLTTPNVEHKMRWRIPARSLRRSVLRPRAPCFPRRSPGSQTGSGPAGQMGRRARPGSVATRSGLLHRHVAEQPRAGRALRSQRVVTPSQRERLRDRVGAVGSTTSTRFGICRWAFAVV
jgi:hypothetical protein